MANPPPGGKGHQGKPRPGCQCSTRGVLGDSGRILPSLSLAPPEACGTSSYTELESLPGSALPSHSPRPCAEPGGDPVGPRTGSSPGPRLSWAHSDGSGVGRGWGTLTHRARGLTVGSVPSVCPAGAECCGVLWSSAHNLSRGATPGGEGGRPLPLQVFQLALTRSPLGWFPVIVSL